MATDDAIKAEINKVRKSVTNIEEEVSERAEKERERSKISKVENIQILVATSIITGYISLIISEIITLPTSLTTCVTNGPFVGCSTPLQLFLTGSFVLAKTSTMTTLPLIESDSNDNTFRSRLEQFDYYWLPAIYVTLVLLSVILGILAFLDGELLILFPAVIYICLGVLVCLTLGRRYAGEYEAAMDRIQTRSHDYVVTATRGPSPETKDIIIENPTSDKIDEGDVRFVVESPDDVDVVISSAYEDPDADGNVWIYSSGLEVGEKRRLSVKLNLNVLREDLEEETVKIHTEVEEERVDTDITKLVG